MKFKTIRNLFWENYPEFITHRRTRKSHNDYNATIRTVFNDFTDYLCKSGEITESQYSRITL